MKYAALALFLAVFGVTLAPGFGDPQTPVKKSAVPKTSSKSAAPGAAKKATVARKTAPGRKTTTRRVAAVPRQAVPTSDRYKEIQQALVTKGYLKSEPSGVWDANSIDAMKRFQTDQHQDPTGKLTAAALIDLGLGPKHEMAPSPVKGPGEAVPEPPKIESAPTPQP